MPNPFLDSGAFNPEITREVGRAYESNFNTIHATDGSAIDISIHSLGDTIKKDTAGSAGKYNSWLGGFEAFSNPELTQAFEDTFTETEEFFGRIGIDIPTPEQCDAAGINLRALGTAFERMQAEGLEPAIVLAPDLTMASWESLYKSLAHDPAVNNDGRIKGDGLITSCGVGSEWDEDLTSKTPSDVPTVTLMGANGSISWSLRIMTSLPFGNKRQVPHEDTEGIYPTVCEHLTLQAIRIQTHEEPINNGFIGADWLSGEVANRFNEHWIPCAFWSNMKGSVELSTLTVRPDDTMALSARTPVQE